MSIAFLPIARPTFDVPFAEEKTAAAWQALETAGLSLVGSTDLGMDAAGVEAAIAQFQATKTDMLLLLQASFADSTMIQQIASTLKLPLMLWAIPEERSGGRLRLNSFCGINLAAHGLKRAGIRYDYLYAAPDDSAAIEKIRTFAKAAEVARKLRTALIGRVGEHPAGFNTCRFDADNLKKRLGLGIVQLELQSVFEGARKADPGQVQALEAKVRGELSGYDTVNQDEARGTLASFLSLKDHAEKHNLQGIAVRCWPEFFTDLGCSACGAMSMLSNEQIPASCEADVNGTITQLMLQWLSGDVAFGTDMVDFDIADDSAVLWHCGLAPLAMADPDFLAEAALHSNRKKPLLMQFPLKAGRVTIARLSEASGELRLVIGGGEMLKRPMSFGGTSGVIRFDTGTESVMNTILREGLEHHVSICYGEHQASLTALAHILDLPVLYL